jgi:3-hydroxyisobutyrate dehydrogenase
MTAIAFFGVGNMGLGMARNLLKAGHAVTVFDLDPEKAKAVEGATVAPDAESAVSGAEVVITMLPSAKAVKAVYHDTIFEHAEKGAVFVDCSTIDVETARTLAGDAKARSHAMLDAPVSGGVAGADAGTLAFMVGGTEEGFAKVQPLFDVMGAKAVLAGEAGAGQGIKICNNMMLAIQMISVAEGFVLAEKLGLEPAKLFEVSSAASAQCWSLTTYCPVAGVGPTTSADNDFKPGFATALMRKDLGLAMEAAEAAGAVVPFGEAARDTYEKMMCEGQGDLDFSAVIKRVRAAVPEKD